MARKADHGPDSKLDWNTNSRWRATWTVAFIAQSHGIGMDYARKKYADVPVGAFWVDIARQVIMHMSWRGEFSATIQ